MFSKSVVSALVCLKKIREGRERNFVVFRALYIFEARGGKYCDILS